jgi:hypothetical protein
MSGGEGLRRSEPCFSDLRLFPKPLGWRTNRVSAMDTTAEKVRRNVHPAWAEKHENQLSDEPAYCAFVPEVMAGESA